MGNNGLSPALRIRDGSEPCLRIPEWDDYFLEIAMTVARKSKDPKWGLPAAPAHLPAERDPARIGRCFHRAAHLGAPHIHKFLSWGSSRTRNQSPKSWVARTIRRMQSPGNTVSHHWPAIKVGRASESMRPQAG